jgi:hypothetical protein
LGCSIRGGVELRRENESGWPGLGGGPGPAPFEALFSSPAGSLPASAAGAAGKPQQGAILAENPRLGEAALLLAPWAHDIYKQRMMRMGPGGSGKKRTKFLCGSASAVRGRGLCGPAKGPCAPPYSGIRSSVLLIARRRLQVHEAVVQPKAWPQAHCTPE